MDLATFEDGLDRHGADLTAWPPDLRTAAAAFLDGSAAARAACRDLAEIEGFLRRDLPRGDSLRAEPPVPDVGMMAARAMRHRQDRPARRAARRAGWAAAAAVALVLGLFIGGVGPDHEDGPDHAMATAFEQLAPIDVD